MEDVERIVDEDEKPARRGVATIVLVIGGIALLLCLCVGAAAVGVFVLRPGVVGQGDQGGLAELFGQAPSDTPPPAITVEVMPEEEEAPADLPTATDTPIPAPPVEADPGWQTAIDDGTISVDAVQSQGFGILGTGIFTVEVSNASDQEVEVVIPPGYVFFPPEGSGEQRMMVLQPASGTVAPGGTLVLDPYVSCIDPEQEAPGEGSGYSPGGPVDNPDLQRLANCLADEDLPTLDMTDLLASGDLFGEEFGAYMGLQMAVWTVGSGQSLETFTGADAQAMPDMGEGQEMFDAMESSATQWLTLCGFVGDQ